MKVTFACKKCLVSQTEDPKEVKKETQEFNGQSINLMYYECPVCRCKNYVQADNEKSKEWLHKMLVLTKQQIGVNRAGRRGKNAGKARKIQIHLRKVRNELQKELENAGYNFVECEVANGDEM